MHTHNYIFFLNSRYKNQKNVNEIKIFQNNTFNHIMQFRNHVKLRFIYRSYFDFQSIGHFIIILFFYLINYIIDLFYFIKTPIFIKLAIFMFRNSVQDFLKSVQNNFVTRNNILVFDNLIKGISLLIIRNHNIEDVISTHGNQYLNNLYTNDLE